MWRRIFDLVAGADDIGRVAIGKTVGQLIEFFDCDALACLRYLALLAGARGAAVFIWNRCATGRQNKGEARQGDANDKSKTRNDVGLQLMVFLLRHTHCGTIMPTEERMSTSPSRPMTMCISDDLI